VAEKIAKMEAVRRALKHFGPDAKPTQMQGWIKDQFQIDMTANHVSTYKGDIRKKRAGKGKPAAPKPAPQKAAARKVPAQTPAAAKQASPPSPSLTSKGGGIPLEVVLTVKDLVVRLGAASVRTLIDAFAR
jgi:hypothetical protein